MAQIPNGILGGISGTVGSVVGGSWRGIPYIRSKAPRRTDNPTPAQQAQRAKFALVGRFVYTLSSLLDFSCKAYAIRMTGTNSVVSYLMQHAITGTSPDFTLDFSKVLISRGELPGVLDPAVVAAGNGMVRFSWTDNSDSNMASANDRAILVVHCPALQQSLYTTVGAYRRAGTYTLEATAFSGQQVHTWVGFISEDGELAADSIYTGELIVL